MGPRQCLDCPNRAALPSERCARFQTAHAHAGIPMAAKDMQRLQVVFDELILALPEAKRGDTLTRLQHLTPCLSEGKIQQPIQQKLLSIADATTAGDRAAAKREVAWLAANHWEQHKYWIIALRRMLA